MANYTQQCRTCHANIEGTGEDICYRCLQRERDALRDEVERLKSERDILSNGLTKETEEIERLHEENERLKSGNLLIREQQKEDFDRAEIWQAETEKLRTDLRAANLEVERLTLHLSAAKENADFLRESVGECHLMISRNTPEFQIKPDWESTTLPLRLQKIMRRIAELEK